MSGGARLTGAHHRTPQTSAYGGPTPSFHPGRSAISYPNTPEGERTHLGLRGRRIGSRLAVCPGPFGRPQRLTGPGRVCPHRVRPRRGNSTVTHPLSRGSGQGCRGPAGDSGRPTWFNTGDRGGERANDAIPPVGSRCTGAHAWRSRSR